VEPDLELMHESIHAEYRQALADAQWALAQANASGKVKDRLIAELTSRLEAADAGPAAEA
jgi:hypothetical protein